MTGRVVSAIFPSVIRLHSMDTTLTPNALMAEQDKRITETISRERGRLGNFIRQRVPDSSEAEDILQDVFFDYVEAYRLASMAVLGRIGEPEDIAGIVLFLVSEESAWVTAQNLGGNGGFA